MSLINEESPYIAYRHRRIKKYRCDQMKRSREKKVVDKEKLIKELIKIYHGEDMNDLKKLINELEEGK